MGTATRDRSPAGELPVDDVDRAAIEGLRFSLAFRGYRQDEVDQVLARLAYELETRAYRIAELEERDWWDEFGRIQCPVLIVRGEHVRAGTDVPL